MPRQTPTARLEDLKAELEALRLFRRQRIITDKRRFEKERNKLLKAIQDLEEDIEQKRRSAEIAQQLAREIAERERKAREKREKAQQKKQFLRTLQRNFQARNEFRIQFGNAFISDREILEFIARAPGRWEISAGGRYYVLNDNTRVRFRELVEGDLVIDEVTNESDGLWNTWVNQIGEINVAPFEGNNQYQMLEGAFFKWTHTTNFDFSRYGIFEDVAPEDYNDNCLIYAFRMWGLDDIKLESLKHFVKNRTIPKKDLPEIGKKVQMNIVLRTSTKTFHYETKYENTICLGLIESHYFLIEKTNVTRFALENYEEIKHLDRPNLICKRKGKYYERDESRCIDSFDVVKILLENKEKLLKEISSTDQYATSIQFYDKVNTEIKSLEYDPEVNTIPILRDEPKSESDWKPEYKNLFIDFETYVKNGKHIPYLCCSYDGKRKRTFFGQDCGYQLLKSLTGNTRLIAHNATYDMRFVIQYLQQIEEISRGQRMISVSAKFGKHYIQIKDSLHLIPKALRCFPEMFQLEGQEKEVMFYNFFSEDTIKKRHHKPSIVEPFVKESERDQFYKNLEKWKLIDLNGEFDIIAYSQKYCEVDVKILFEGYTTFRSWLLKLVSIDIDEVLTIASVAHRYFVNQGCYDGVVQLSGTPQVYIQEAVVGGRTMVSENKKKRVEGKINDFDAVSLYPSAMRRMDGFLKGIPKVLTELSYDFLKQQDGYFVDIQITGIGVKRKFPLLSSKIEGIRIFSNDMIGKVIRVDRYTLEDLIEFQGITFNIKRGYYFNEGFNNKINEVIDFVFQERLRLKKEKNPAQEVFKLIMNSGYGKSIMKPVETETQFFDDEERFKVWLSRHYNWVISYTKFANKIKVKLVKTLDEHFNIAHVGTMILSMSKRIMNEVMCLAEDNNLEIYYQDTDSIHILDKDIAVLASLFKEKYKRDLIGKGFGQFHSDFDLEGATDVYSRRAIFLGKKAYIDELVGKGKNGEEIIGHHIRLKGVPNSVLLYHAKKLGYPSPFEMYEDMYKGKAISFDLTNDGTKANFKLHNDYTITTESYFVRTLQFSGA